MGVTCRIGCGVAIGCLITGAFGQHRVPLADDVDQPLVPPGILEQSIGLSAELAYLFKSPDGTDVVHLVGHFALRVGHTEGQELHSREAVVWLTPRKYNARPYNHVQIFLWREAEVTEIGGTTTRGPALFVTLNTFGKVTTHADDVAFESSADTQAYREGDLIRKSISASARGRPEWGEDTSMRVFDASGLGVVEEAPAPRAVLLFRSEGELAGPVAYGEHEVLTVVGGAYLSRGTPGTGTYLEIRADSVVVFLVPSAKADQEDSEQAAGLGADARGPDAPAAAHERRQARGPGAGDRQLMSTGFGDVAVEGVYLEGDIVMSQGPNRVYASRLYYDFIEERAIILDAVVRTMLAERGVPLYMRAAEIRQLSAKRFTAEDAILTTSEFHTPHYHIGAARVELTNLTPSSSGERQPGLRTGAFRIHHATLNLSGVPVAYWPYIRGNIDTSETAIKSTRAGFSDDWGVELETEWHLFNLLNLKTPEGFNAVLSLDYFSSRGPALGVDVDYVRDRYFGYLKSYLLWDNDEDFLGRERETLAQKDTRGRFLWRHRQYLEDDWQVSLELSYISDRGFLEELFETEFDTGKEQETLLYLKKQRENWAFTALAQTRLMDFTTATERLPDFAFFLVGQPLGEHTTWYSEYRGGIVRYRPADQTFRELLRDGRATGSGSVLRVDSRQELDFPLEMGPVHFVPFVVARSSVWDDSVSDGGTSRSFAMLGVRGSAYLSKIYPEAKSSLLDIDGVRHVIKPDITAWVSSSNRDADDLFPFDETVEGTTGADGVTFGVRQRWQTKRGGDATRRIVDLFTLDVEAGFFNDADGSAITNGYTSYRRPENSITRNYVNSSAIWRVNDRTALLSELNYDINDGEIDILNLSVAVERTPRLSYLFGYRFIEESNSNLLGFDMNYRLTEKHTVALRERFDIGRGRTLDVTV
ncbi:MAG: LPS-assembly protein LptD, partial [Phycisphaerae bacterium]